ncbi:MAG: hypothetical protein IPJ43_21040 [Saprospiraceae bacterium]|nr:hypothetical protein [Saprospiraceae bacterium]
MVQTHAGYGISLLEREFELVCQSESPYRRDDGVEAYDLPPLCTRMSEFELFGQRIEHR